MTPRLFYPQALSLLSRIIFPSTQGHYLRTVLRLLPGDAVILFNEQEGEWLGELKEVNKKNVEATLTKFLRPAPVSKPPLIAMLALIKPARFEMALEKLTELGVSEIYPLLTEYSQKRPLNTKRLQMLLIEAVEQSNQIRVPILHPLTTLSEILQGKVAPLILVGDERKDQSLVLSEALGQLKKEQAHAFIVGPEGGFSSQEFALLARSSNCQLVCLGESILRAETAAITFAAVLQNWRISFKNHH